MMYEVHVVDRDGKRLDREIGPVSNLDLPSAIQAVQTCAPEMEAYGFFARGWSMVIRPLIQSRRKLTTL